MEGPQSTAKLPLCYVIPCKTTEIEFKKNLICFVVCWNSTCLLWLGFKFAIIVYQKCFSLFHYFSYYETTLSINVTKRIQCFFRFILFPTASIVFWYLLKRYNTPVPFRKKRPLSASAIFTLQVLLDIGQYGQIYWTRRSRISYTKAPAYQKQTRTPRRHQQRVALTRKQIHSHDHGHIMKP